MRLWTFLPVYFIILSVLVIGCQEQSKKDEKKSNRPIAKNKKQVDAASKTSAGNFSYVPDSSFTWIQQYHETGDKVYLRKILDQLKDRTHSDPNNYMAQIGTGCLSEFLKGEKAARTYYLEAKKVLDRALNDVPEFVRSVMKISQSDFNEMKKDEKTKPELENYIEIEEVTLQYYRQIVSLLIREQDFQTVQNQLKKIREANPTFDFIGWDSLFESRKELVEIFAVGFYDNGDH